MVESNSIEIKVLLNPLVPGGRFGCNRKLVIFKLKSRIDILNIVKLPSDKCHKDLTDAW